MDQKLIERIEGLEKRNKVLCWILIVLVIAFAFLLRHEFENTSVLEHPDRFVANSIEVESLVARSIQVVGSHGKNSVSMEATRDGWATLSFRDLNGVGRTGFLLTPSGKPTLQFSKDNVARMILGVTDTEGGSEYTFEIRDKNGKVIWHPDVENPY